MSLPPLSVKRAGGSMRRLATEKHLDQPMFDQVAVKLAKVFKGL